MVPESERVPHFSGIYVFFCLVCVEFLRFYVVFIDFWSSFKE